MNAKHACTCSERQKKPEDRAWVITVHKGNYSAFNGYKFTPSDYSAVMCTKCLKMWRTKADYVKDLQIDSNIGKYFASVDRDNSKQGRIK